MANIKRNAFRFSIDRGGTFTDVYAEVPGKPGFKVVKLLSEDPGNYDDAPREGIRRILEEYAQNSEKIPLTLHRLSGYGWVPPWQTKSPLLET